MVASLNRKYRMLIADDDFNFRSIVRIVFDQFFETIEADSGEQAVEIAESASVDIALLDMHMQELTGLETIRLLKSINETAPCILITSDQSREVTDDAVAADAYSVIHKPVQKRVLIQTVSTALSDVYHDPEVFSELNG